LTKDAPYDIITVNNKARIWLTPKKLYLEAIGKGKTVLLRKHGSNVYFWDRFNKQEVEVGILTLLRWYFNAASASEIDDAGR